MKTFAQYAQQIDEKAPPSKEAEEWVKKNKARFKEQYGEDWEQVLYATAWKLFGKKEGLDEKTFYDAFADYVGRKLFNTKTYKIAFEELKKAFKASGKRHNLLHVAQTVARKYSGVEYRELAAMYIDAYPQYADEITGRDQAEFDYLSGKYE